jgi:hypothetical protein
MYIWENTHSFIKPICVLLIAPLSPFGHFMERILQKLRHGVLKFSSFRQLQILWGESIKGGYYVQD